MATTVRALSGDAELLERLTATPFAATVHSVFDRVANLRLPYDGQLCTVATVGIDNAPATLVVDTPTVRTLRLQVGDTVTSHRARMLFPGGRGVDVRGLLWRSHWRKFGFHSERAFELGKTLEAHGGECLRDMRVRTGGAHHQKFVVLRHRDDPTRDVAYAGGIDLCHSRRDDHGHGGDPQPLAIAPEYGPNPAWHDVQVAVRGPAVHDVETTFRERWEDDAPLTSNPGRRFTSWLQAEDQDPDPPSSHDQSGVRCR